TDARADRDRRPRAAAARGRRAGRPDATSSGRSSEHPPVIGARSHEHLLTGSEDRLLPTIGPAHVDDQPGSELHVLSHELAAEGRSTAPPAPAVDAARGRGQIETLGPEG